MGCAQSREVGRNDIYLLIKCLREESGKRLRIAGSFGNAKPLLPILIGAMFDRYWTALVVLSQPRNWLLKIKMNETWERAEISDEG